MCFKNSYHAYPCKNQKENPSNLINLNLYKSIVTGNVLKYHLPQEHLCICRNCEVVKIDKSDLEKTVMRKNMRHC